MFSKKLPGIALIAALITGPAFAASHQGPGDRVTPAQRRALDAFGQNVNVVLDDQDVPAFLIGPLSARESADPVSAADSALSVHGAAFRRGVDDAFRFRLLENDEIGQTHVRMTQTYKGVPVVDGELIVHLGTDGVRGINGRFVADLDLDVNGRLSDPQAAAQVTDFVNRAGGQILEIAEVGSMVIFEGRASIPVKVLYKSETGLALDELYVDATIGGVLGRRARLYTAKTRSLYNMNQACISTGNEMPGTLLFNEGGSSSDTAAMGAYNGTGTTYDFYKAVFNRDSYDNAGALLKSSVHAQFSSGTSCDKNNAAWFDTPYAQMAYGDGDGTTFTNLASGLDVTAHELTHAVCSRTANLTYAKESGALNEANSDILGRTAAFWSGQGDPTVQSAWTIGADVYTPGTSGDALRYFYNPTADGYSTDYYPTRLYSGTCTASQSNDECGVHGNSGIANLFYYLLTKGGTHPRGVTTVNVPGVGITVSRAIWYRALSTYMTASTNFQGARTATASAAADLYGGSCSATWQSVQMAWDAVGVPGTWSCGTTFTISGNAGTTGVTVSTTGASATSDASSNYTLSNLAAGTYTVTPSKSGCTFSPASQSVTVGPNATGKNFTASCTSTDTQLTSGVTLSGQSVALQAWKYYYINVPSGATNLTFATTAATADLDIYTQSGGVKPTLTAYVCRPYTSSGNETCSATNPAAGTWYLGVYGYAAGSFSVTATVTTGSIDTTLPTVSISSPTAGTTITGATTVSATAADNVGVAKVEFYLDGVLQSTDTTSPYSWSWAPTSAQNGTHSLTAKAYDAANNIGTSSAVSVTVSISTSCTPQQLITNGGFETGTASPWTSTTGVVDNSAGEAAHAGSWKAWMNGYGSAHTDTLAQTVTIPACATTATLSFWLHIDTAETGTTAYDKLTVTVKNTSGTVLGTLATYSNANAATGFSQKSFSLASYKGQTVQIYFTGVEDASAQTSFVIDDVALNTQ